LDLIRHGYKVPFVTEPQSDDLDNNATVKNNHSIAEEQVHILLQQGVLRKVSQKPHCVSPLGLVTKQVQGGGVKHRLIFDGSRLVNDSVDPPMVKLAHLQKALLKINCNQLLGVFDLKSCYFHIKIHPSQTTYFGVKLVLNGILSYMVYDYLPFGLSSAVHCVTKIWKPLIVFFQKRNIPLSVYIDDGLFSADCAESWNHKREFIWDVITKAGWTIEVEKSDSINMGSMSKQYLGFVVNTKDMKIFLPSDKLTDIRNMISAFLPLQRCSAKKLAKVLGKVVSCIPSHGPFSRICTRSGYRDLQMAVDKFGWSCQVELSEATIRELKLFSHVLGPRNGFPIRHHLTDVRIETFLSQPVCKQNFIRQAQQHYDAIVISDASDFKVSCKWLEGPSRDSLSFSLSSTEQCYSSGERELLAMLKSLRHFHFSMQLKNINLIWATDSENLVSFIEKGSSKQRIHDKITDVYTLCHVMNCTIEPVHLLRVDERIQQVDHLSKVRDSDNWSIDDFSFQKFHKLYAFTIDVFADAANKRLPMFISKNFELGCFAVDAFASEWPGVAWVCPPTNQLSRVAARIRKSKCEGLVLVPDWPASDFFNTFFGNELSIKSPFHFVEKFTPYIFQNENARNTPLFGVPQFQFFALYFNTK